MLFFAGYTLNYEGAAAFEGKGSDIMNEFARSEPKPSKSTGRKHKSTEKQRSKSLLLATDSAIDRLKTMSQPGGDIEQMDIKDLKNLISSIKELSTLSTDLADKKVGGVVVLPEVEISE